MIETLNKIVGLSDFSGLCMGKTVLDVYM